MHYPRPGTFVGFDRLFAELNKTIEHKDTYPPHNIFKVAGSSNYVLELACAGYKMQDLEVSVEKNVLTIGTRKEYEQSSEKTVYYHRGISQKRFRKVFNLDESIEVKGASMTNGILTVELAEIIPEQQKRKTIDIWDGAGKHTGPPQFLTE